MKVKVTQSCPTHCNPMNYVYVSPGQNTVVGSLSLFQGIFPTQGSNPGLPHCRRILYQLSHKGSPRILEWVAYPFSRGSSWPGNQTGVSWIAGGFFTNWAIREVLAGAYCETYQKPFSPTHPICEYVILSGGEQRDQGWISEWFA